MKSILYVGATLMIGASIYGFVDYQQTSHKKEFTDMYKEKEVTEAVETVDTKTAVMTDKKEVTAKDVKTSTAVVEKKSIKNPENKKKRTFNSKLFSRGALDERYIEEKVKVEPVKETTEPVKSENKEQ